MRPRTPTPASGLLGRDLALPSILAVALLARIVIAVEWVWGQSFEVGDLHYYFERTRTLPVVGMDQSLREYPTPMAWMLTWPQVLSGGNESAYVFWFVALILVADVGFCVVLWRSGAAYRGWAVACWSILLTALGPLVWLRFDLLPAVMVGAAAVLAIRRPASAGALLAVGAGMKLWPALLFPLLLNRPDGVRRKDWFAPLVGFSAAGIVIVVLSLVFGGWERLVSPLHWQADRGLQIESVPATALMALRAVAPDTWTVTVSRYQAFEIFGPGVAEWLIVADVMGLVGVAVGLALLLRHLASRRSGRAAWALRVATTMLAIIGLLIVVNKTLSPQYIVWLVGPVVALVAWHGPGHRAVGRWVATVLAIAALSHLIYPVLYDRINGMADDPFWTPVATLALVARNLLLVAFTTDVAIAAWRGVRRGEQPTA